VARAARHECPGLRRDWVRTGSGLRQDCTESLNCPRCVPAALATAGANRARWHSDPTSMSTLPIGRGMELMDWLGLAAVGLNLLMLTLGQAARGKKDKRGRLPWDPDRPVPVRANPLSPCHRARSHLCGRV
jgi:hypothetical protein